MTDDLEGRIRDRAHEMWEHAGRPEGESERFWHTAEQELTLNPASTMSREHDGPTPPPVVPEEARPTSK